MFNTDWLPLGMNVNGKGLICQSWIISNSTYFFVKTAISCLIIEELVSDVYIGIPNNMIALNWKTNLSTAHHDNT